MTIPEVAELPAHLVAGGKLLPSRLAMLELLPKNAIFVEVGVGLGVFSEAALRICKPHLFVAIDNFRLHELPSLWGQKTEELFENDTHINHYRKRFSMPIASGQMQIIEADSHSALDQLDDASVDVFYIDADHSYEAVVKDLAAARPKVRPDGYLIVNDYIMVDGLNATSYYGVVPATNEFMIKHNWRMEYFVLQTRMFCDVVLRQSELLRVQDLQLKIPAPDKHEVKSRSLVWHLAAAAVRRTLHLWQKLAPGRVIGLKNQAK